MKCPERTFTIYVMSHRAAIATEEEITNELETDLRLAAHLRALSAVSVATGHDMRQPLHTMTIYLELLRRTIGEPPVPDTQAHQEQYVEVLASELKSMETMLDQLLDQIRLAGEGTERFDLVETVRSLREFLEPHRRDAKIEFHWRDVDAAIRIEGNRGAIRHALFAILIAAMGATPKGAELTLGITASDGQATIAISGAAVPVPDVARRVVERHGGSIDIRSDASRVADLVIQLPLTAAGNG